MAGTFLLGSFQRPVLDQDPSVAAIPGGATLTLLGTTAPDVGTVTAVGSSDTPLVWTLTAGAITSTATGTQVSLNVEAADGDAVTLTGLASTTPAFRVSGSVALFVPTLSAEDVAALIVDLDSTFAPIDPGSLATHGADPTGQADAAGAIAAASAAAGSGPLTVPTGTYKVGSALTRPDGQAWIGGGAAASTLKWSGAAAVMLGTNPAGVATDQSVIRDLCLDGNGSATSCFVTQHGTYLTIERVKMKGSTGSVLIVTGANCYVVRDSILTNAASSGYVVQLLADTVSGCNVGLLSNTQIYTSAGANGLLVDSSATYETGDVTFQNVNFEGGGIGNVGAKLGATYTVRQITFEDCYWESWLGACIAANIVPVDGLAVRGGIMNVTSAASSCINLYTPSAAPGRIEIRDVAFAGMTSSQFGILLPYSANDVEIVGNTQINGGAGTLIKIGAFAYPYADLVIRPVDPTDWVGTGDPASQGGSKGNPYYMTPKVGDRWWRQDTPGTSGQRLYVCTASGATSTWSALA